MKEEQQEIRERNKKERGGEEREGGKKMNVW